MNRVLILAEMMGYYQDKINFEQNVNGIFIMDLLQYKKDGFLHFIGCGGAGTRPLMRIFHEPDTRKPSS